MMRDETRLKALTVYQPWAWAIAAGHKPVENRSWAPPRTLLDSYLAIHSAMKAERQMDGMLADLLARTGLVPAQDELVFGAIVAVCRVTGHVTERDKLPPSWQPWFTGPCAWVLAEVRRLPSPVPATGMQGLWTPTPSQLAEVRRQWKAAA